MNLSTCVIDTLNLPTCVINTLNLPTCVINTLNLPTCVINTMNLPTCVIGTLSVSRKLPSLKVSRECLIVSYGQGSQLSLSFLSLGFNSIAICKFCSPFCSKTDSLFVLLYVK